MSPQAGRERILDATLRLFAERGPDGTTVRDIAAAAEVSPANVLHHFGSKDALREAANAHVADTFRRMLATDPEHLEAIGGKGENPAGSLAEMFAAALPPDSPLPGYLRRLILDGDPAADELVTAWVDGAEGLLAALEAEGAVTPTGDPRARAAFLVANDLVILLMRAQLGAALGTDPLSPEGLHRWSATAMSAYTAGIYAAPTGNPPTATAPTRTKETP